MTTRPALPPELRARCEATIERLLALLDACDGPDDDLEPSLGYYPPHVPWDAEADGPGGVSDDEPSIGAPETTAYGQTASQEFTWALPSSGAWEIDCEYDPAENGLGDADGAAEQLGRFQGVAAD